MSGSRGGPRDWDRSESRDVEAGTGRFEFPEDGEHWTTIWTGGVRLQSLTPSERDSLTIAAALALGRVSLEQHLAGISDELSRLELRRSLSRCP